MKKILTLRELEHEIARIKAEGKTIAHCHGCFDLMHSGHIKHFESAKKIADVLVVTLTQDKYVNKGPGRPVFNENQRAEAIAALGCVDFVAINNWPTAEETIKIVQPTFYVKGPDYKDQSKDITNNIGKEEAAVIAVGGKLHLTEDDTFSSSNLINAHFSQLSDNLQDYLRDFKTKHSLDEILNHIDQLKDLKVLVIGDTIIDEYHTCTPLGKSSKSPTISTIFRKEVAYTGGILAIANHIQEYTKEVHLISILGDDNKHLDLIDKKLNSAITSKFFKRKQSPTNIKRRYIDTYLNLKLFEVTFINDTPIETQLENEIIPTSIVYQKIMI